MYQLEKFKVTIPSKTYLENSKLIKQIGITSKTLDEKQASYWTKTPSYTSAFSAYEFIVTKDGEFTHGDVFKDVSYVRPLIKAANIEEIVKSSPMHLYKKGIKMIEFGKWYSQKVIKVSDIDEPVTPHYKKDADSLALPVEINGKEYVISANEVHPLVPIMWYYDEENGLLLAEKALFPSLLHHSSVYDGNFKESSLYKILNYYFLPNLFYNINVQNLQESEIDTLKYIKKLTEENEKLKKENETLKSSRQYTKMPSQIQILK